MASPSIWLVGCGNMGGAMLRGWLGAGIAADGILVIDPIDAHVPEGVRAVARADGPAPDILLLGIKPQMLDEVAPTLAIGAETIVISILAGVECAVLAKKLPGARHYVRVMPNMPAAISAEFVVQANDFKLHTCGVAFVGFFGQILQGFQLVRTDRSHQA